MCSAHWQGQIRIIGGLSVALPGYSYLGPVTSKEVMDDLADIKNKVSAASSAEQLADGCCDDV